MDKDFSADFESEALPSIATLERYVGGDMADDERERLEAQIAKDPLLADAVEGLKMSRADSDLSARFSRIRSRVASSVEAMPQTDSLASKRKSRVKPFPQYLVYTAVAAGFALLLVFVGLMKDGQEKQEPQNPELITQNQPTTFPAEAPETQDSQAPEPVAESPALAPEASNNISTTTEPAIIPSEPERELRSEAFDENGNDDWGAIADEEVADDMLAVQAPPAPQAQAVPEPVAANSGNSNYEPADPSTLYTTEQGEVKEAEELAKLTEIAVREETEVIREPTRPASATVVPTERARRNQDTPPTVDFNTDDLEYQKEADQTAGAVSKAQVMADLLTEAIRLHDNQELDSAQLFLDEVLLSEPHNVVAAYYKGKSLVDQEAFTEAVDFLLIATEVETSAVFEEARWQLAKAYEGAGKKRKARSLLTSISEESGKYQAEAATLLQNMD